MALFEESVVRYMIRRGYSHKGISDYNRNLYLDRRGFSTRNVRRFCMIRGITRISDNEVAAFAGCFIVLYGHGYGRLLIDVTEGVRWVQSHCPPEKLALLKGMFCLIFTFALL